jgi:hypothetical protein
MAAALLERRLSSRISLIGHPTSFESIITASGENGFVKAIEPVLKSVWQAWEDDYLKRIAGAEQDRPQFHCERTGSEQVRVTRWGEQAQQDLRDGLGGQVLDCVHRRRRYFGMLIGGEGRCEMIRAVVAQTTPAKVEVVNPVELANSGPLAEMAQAMQKGFEMLSKALNGNAQYTRATSNGARDSVAKGAGQPEDTDFLSATEVADTCHKSPGRISQLCKEGKIEHRKDAKGKVTKVSLVSAQAYFAKTAKERTRKTNGTLARDWRKDTRDLEQDEGV